MKKILSLLLSFMSCAVSFAQDVIIDTSGTRTEARILTINDAEITYKRFSNPNGPTYTKRIEKIASIEYENGDVDDFLEKAETDGNIWGDASLPELDYESYDGFLLAKGNVVFIPNARTAYEQVAVQYLRERIAADGFWKLALRKSQAHFQIVYEVNTRGRDRVKQTFLQRRDPFTKEELAKYFTTNLYGDSFFGDRQIRAGGRPAENIRAAEKLYEYILAIQKNIEEKNVKEWHSLFVK